MPDHSICEVLTSFYWYSNISKSLKDIKYSILDIQLKSIYITALLLLHKEGRSSIM